MCALLMSIFMLTLAVQVAAVENLDYFEIPITDGSGTVQETDGIIDMCGTADGDYAMIYFAEELNGNYDISFEYKLTGFESYVMPFIYFVNDAPRINEDPLATESARLMYSFGGLAYEDSNTEEALMTPFEQAQWYTFCITREGGMTIIYVDGHNLWNGEISHDNIQIGISMSGGEYDDKMHHYVTDVYYSTVLRPPPIPEEPIAKPSTEDEPESKPEPFVSLCLTDIVHSETVQIGDNITVALNIANTGNIVAKDVDVTVYFNEYKLACNESTLKLGDIRAGEKVAISFTLTAIQEGDIKLWIEANADKNYGTSTIVSIVPVEKCLWFNPWAKPFFY